MRKPIQRALLRIRIHGSPVVTNKRSRIANSFGKGPGERKPDYRTLRRYVRAMLKNPPHIDPNAWTVHAMRARKELAHQAIRKTLRQVLRGLDMSEARR